MPAAISGRTMASCRRLPAASPGRERNFLPVMKTLLKNRSRNDERALDGLAKILFVSRFQSPAQHFPDHLGQPLRPRFRLAIVKDTEQMCPPMRWRHALPFRTGFGVLAKSQLHDWRKRKFGFHGFHQALGNLLRPA